MMKRLSEIRLEAKKVPKSVWIASMMIPFGWCGLTLYLATKAYLENKNAQKEKADYEN